MKLQRAQVQNFRSIVDSGPVDIDDRVTVLIGKNEQGKTTFLRGLSSFNEKYPYSPSDLPHHLRPNLELQKKSDIPIITIWLVPDDKEREDISSTIDGVNDIGEFKITRYYDGNYQYVAIGTDGKEVPLKFAAPNIQSQVDDLKRSAEGLKAKLGNHASRLEGFAPQRPQADSHIDSFLNANFKEHAQIDNLIKTLTTVLTGIPNQDQPIQDDIAQMTREMQAKHTEIQKLVQADGKSAFRAKIPKFVLHITTTDQIPNDVNLAEFLKDPENTSKGMANLCRAAGLTIQKIQELSSVPEASVRESYEDNYKAAISGAIN